MNTSKIIALAACLISSFYCHSQGLNANITPEQWNTFKTNKIYFVFMGNAKFDSALKKAANEEWKLTQIAGFTDKNGLKQLISDKSLSFIIPTEWNYEERQRLNSDRYSSGLYAINGGKKKFSKYDYIRDVIMMVGFNVYGSEKKMEEAAYRLPFAIHVLNGNFYPDKAYNSKGHLKEKTLLLNEKIVRAKNRSWNSVDEGALKAYKYKYEIASESRIDSLVATRDNKYALLVPILSDMIDDVSIYDLGDRGILCSYHHRGTIWKFPWVRDEAFETFNEC